MAAATGCYGGDPSPSRSTTVIINETLRTDLRELATKAGALGKALGQGDDLPGPALMSKCRLFSAPIS